MILSPQIISLFLSNNCSEIFNNERFLEEDSNFKNMIVNLKQRKNLLMKLQDLEKEH